MARKLETKYTLRAEDKTKEALRSMQNNFKNTNSAIGKVTGSLGKLGGAFAGLAAIGSIAGIVKLGTDAVKGADHINKMSKALNISTEALSQYQYAAKLSGLENSQLEAGFRTMNQRISEASRGMGEGAKYLKILKLNAGALNDLNADEKFQVMAQALSEVKNASDRAMIAGKLFGEEVGAKMLPAINDGAAGIRKMKEEADALGATLSQDAADDASNALDAMTKLETAFTTFARKIAPAITSALNWINETVFGTEEEKAIKEKTKSYELMRSKVENELRKMGAHQAKAYSERIPIDSGFKGRVVWITRTNEAYEQLVDRMTKERLAAQQVTPETDTVAKVLQARAKAMQNLISLGMPDVSPVAGGSGRPSREEPFIDPFAGKAEVLRQETADMKVRLDALKASNIALEESFLNLADGGINVVADSFGMMFEAMLAGEGAVIEFGRMMRRMVAQVISSLTAMILKMIVAVALMSVLGLGASTGRFAKALRDFGGLAQLDGQRASGGPVGAKKTYLVGEKGPELFTPSVSGSITPNNQLGQPVYVTNNINIDAKNNLLNDPLSVRRVTKAIAEDMEKISKSYYIPAAV